MLLVTKTCISPHAYQRFVVEGFGKCRNESVTCDFGQSCSDRCSVRRSLTRAGVAAATGADCPSRLHDRSTVLIPLMCASFTTARRRGPRRAAGGAGGVFGVVVSLLVHGSHLAPARLRHLGHHGSRSPAPPPPPLRGHVVVQYGAHGPPTLASLQGFSAEAQEIRMRGEGGVGRCGGGRRVAWQAPVCGTRWSQRASIFGFQKA